MKNFNCSFAQIDDMDLVLLLDLINVYDKINSADNPKDKNKVTYKVLD